jgi:hypothetical protein
MKASQLKEMSVMVLGYGLSQKKPYVSVFQQAVSDRGGDYEQAEAQAEQPGDQWWRGL